MDSNKTVTATFTQDCYTLTVNTVGSGSVTRTPDLSCYLSGSVVGLDPQAAAGWTFTGWSGDLSGSSDPENITMDSNKTVTATFEPANILNYLRIQGWNAASGCHGGQDIHEETPDVPYLINTGLWLSAQDHTPNVKHINFVALCDDISTTIEYSYRYQVKYQGENDPRDWTAWTAWSTAGRSSGEDGAYGYGFLSGCMYAPSDTPTYYCFGFEIEIRVNGDSNTYTVHID